MSGAGARPVGSVERAALAALRRLVFSERVPFAAGRTRLRAATMAGPVPRGVTLTEERWGEVAVEVLSPQRVEEGRYLLYAHGGGYCLGAPAMGRALGAELATRLRATWVGVDYRLAPEHPAPAQRDDVAAVLRELSERGEVAAVGDSAGAGALVAALRVAPAPRALVLVSPWLDLATGVGGGPDHLLSAGWLAACARATGLAADDPVVSPLKDLPDLPATLVVGTDEDLLAPDAGALSARPGVESLLVAGQFHDFALQVGRSEAADEAARRAAVFLAHATGWSGDLGWITQ